MEPEVEIMQQNTYKHVVGLGKKVVVIDRSLIKIYFKHILHLWPLWPLLYFHSVWLWKNLPLCIDIISRRCMDKIIESTINA